MKTIIAGMRDFHDKEEFLRAWWECPWRITTVISGGASGVDRMAEQEAQANGIPLIVVEANWSDLNKPGAVIRLRRDGSKYNAKAGPDRNLEMARQAEALLAIWDGKSRGTGNMIYNAKEAGLRVHIHRVDSNPQRRP